MFYNADWSGVNISEFIGILNFGTSFAPEHKKELLRALLPVKLEWMKNRKDLQK